MSLQGSVTDNLDNSKNLTLGVVGGDDKNAVSANMFVNNYTDGPAPGQLKPLGPSYSSAGATLSLQNAGGHAGSLAVEHLPDVGKMTGGNKLSAGASVNLLKTENHSINAHATSTLNVPKGPHPSFATHGGGIDYAFRDKVGVGASMVHTPMFNTTQQSVSASLNLQNTPTSSMNLGLGASRINTPASQGSWKPGAIFEIRRKF